MVKGFFWIFLFCFSSFGKKVLETDPAFSKKTVSEKEESKTSTDFVETNQGSNTSFSSVSQRNSSMKWRGFKEPLTYYEALDRYKKVASIEWAMGLGLTAEFFTFAPMVLEFHVPIVSVDPKLTVLFQAGTILAETRSWVVPVSRISGLEEGPKRFISSKMRMFPIFQAGLKRRFSNQLYASFKLGPVGLFDDLNLWTGGLFFGADSFGGLTLEVGLQPFYLPDEGLWDFGMVMNMGLVLKNWWSLKF